MTGTGALTLGMPATLTAVASRNLPLLITGDSISLPGGVLVAGA